MKSILTISFVLCSLISWGQGNSKMKVTLDSTSLHLLDSMKTQAYVNLPTYGQVKEVKKIGSVTIEILHTSATFMVRHKGAYYQYRFNSPSDSTKMQEFFTGLSTSFISYIGIFNTAQASAIFGVRGTTPLVMIYLKKKAKFNPFIAGLTTVTKTNGTTYGQNFVEQRNY